MTLVLGGIVVFSAGLWYAAVLVINFFGYGYFENASAFEAFKSPAFWALVLLIPVVVTLRDFLWKFYLRQFRPHPYHIVQEIKLAKPPKAGEKGQSTNLNLIFEGTNNKPKKSRGFSFSKTFGQSRVLQAYGQSPKLTRNLRSTSF